MGLLRCFLCFLSFLQMYRSAPILIRWIQHTREKRKGLRGRISNFENRGNCGSEAKTDENHETENCWSYSRWTSFKGYAANIYKYRTLSFFRPFSSLFLLMHSSGSSLDIGLAGHWIWRDEFPQEPREFSFVTSDPSNR
jgi:hypothetical protein